MSYVKKLKVSKEEIKSKLELMDDNTSFKKLTTEEYLRRLFTVNLDLKIQQDANDDLRIGNPILRIEKNNGTGYFFKVVNQNNLKNINKFVQGKRVLGNGVAILGGRPNVDLTTAYYSITIDLDWVSKRKLQNILKFIEENNLLVNFITVSGTGLHITFLIEEVINNEKQAELLYEIKKSITNFLWGTLDSNGEPLFVEPYIFGTREENKKQSQGINQGFAMPGSNFKDDFNMPEEYKVSTYLINEKRISLKDLQENIKQADKQNLYGPIHQERETTGTRYIKTDDYNKHSDNSHLVNMAKHLISNLIKNGENLGNGRIIAIGHRRKTTEAIAGMFKFVGVSEKKAIEIIESFSLNYYVNNDFMRMYTIQELKENVKNVYSGKTKTKWLNLYQIHMRTGIKIITKRERRKFANHSDYLKSISEQYKEGKYIPGVKKTFDKLIKIKEVAIKNPRILTDKYSLQRKLNILNSNDIKISKSTLKKYLEIINDPELYNKYKELAQANKKLISSLTEEEVKEINYKQNADRFLIYQYTMWDEKRTLTYINKEKLLNHFKYTTKDFINTSTVIIQDDFMIQMIKLLSLIKEEYELTYHCEEVLDIEKDLENRIDYLKEKEPSKVPGLQAALQNYKNFLKEINDDIQNKTKIWNGYYKAYKNAVIKDRIEAKEELIKEFNSLMSKVNKKARGFKKIENKPLFSSDIMVKIKEINKDLRKLNYTNILKTDEDYFETYETLYKREYNRITIDITNYAKTLKDYKEQGVLYAGLLVSVVKQYDTNNKCLNYQGSRLQNVGTHLYEKVTFLNNIVVFLRKNLKQLEEEVLENNISEIDNNSDDITIVEGNPFFAIVKRALREIINKDKISIKERTYLLSNLMFNL